MNTQPDREQVEKATEFLQRYHKEDVMKLTWDRDAVWVDHNDLFAFNADMAEELLESPEDVLRALEIAVGNVDTPNDDALDEAPVRITNLPSSDIIAPGQVRADHGEKLVSVRGILERVTTTSDTPTEVCFECIRCGSLHYIPQQIASGNLEQPTECHGCERQGPFDIIHDKTDWNDYAKVRIEARPDVDSDNDGKITGYVLNDLINVGGESGIMDRVGEPVVLTGIVQRVQKQGRGANELLFDHHLKVNGIEFEKDEDTIDIAEHKDTFTELSKREDAIDIFAESIAPQLHETKAWESAMEFGVAYLFGAPRIDIPNGPTYRGDLHFMILSDYGMGKSTFKQDIEAFSPKCISKSTTALSSGVGLTAAAVKDDFGEGQWTIKPGLLVRANGGHLILDEIDKGPDQLTDMNDALEGEQTVDVEKAGKSATYQSRTGVMALGNPVDGRFNQHESIASQLGIKDSLLSRFDGIVTMRDTAHEDTDEAVAETFGKAYTEAQEAQIEGKEEFDELKREVPIDVGRAWIQYARENVDPILRYEQFEELKSWYAEDVRQLNESFASENGEGSDMPVPATVRELAAAAKMSIAFARVHLCDEVEERHVERAKKLAKRLVKQNWDGEKFDSARTSGGETDKSQQTRRENVKETIEEYGTITYSELAAQTREDYEVIKNDVDRMPEVNVLPNNKVELK